jgi:response regulator RpfG family c-di-GMP phosphodiesterase
MPATNQHDERVLVLAPLGRDGAVTAELVRERGLAAEVCTDADAAARQMAAGAGALVMAEEALEQAGVSELLAQLHAQPPWSELPLIILTRGGESRQSRLLDLAAQAAGVATLLERPLAATTLLRTIEVALRSRRRQYQVRDLLAQQRQQTAALQAARVAALNLVDEAERAATALRESEGRLQQALGVSRSFTFEWLPATDEVLRSANCGVILGLSDDEIHHDTGRRYFQRVHSDDRARFVGMVRDLTPAASTYTTE